MLPQFSVKVTNDALEGRAEPKTDEKSRTSLARQESVPYVKYHSLCPLRSPLVHMHSGKRARVIWKERQVCTSTVRIFKSKHHQRNPDATMAVRIAACPSDSHLPTIRCTEVKLEYCLRH
jgi:hypothetical protein